VWIGKTTPLVPGFHQVTDAQLESAQIEIARAAVRHFALSAEVLALDTATLNLPQIER
jgi:hypothetical protein